MHEQVTSNLHLISTYLIKTWKVSIFRPTSVSGVIEHIELDKGLDMVDKAGIGEKMNKSEMT